LEDFYFEKSVTNIHKIYFALEKSYDGVSVFFPGGTLN